MNCAGRAAATLHGRLPGVSLDIAAALKPAMDPEALAGGDLASYVHCAAT